MGNVGWKGFIVRLVDVGRTSKSRDTFARYHHFEIGLCMHGKSTEHACMHTYTVHWVIASEITQFFFLAAAYFKRKVARPANAMARRTRGPYVRREISKNKLCTGCDAFKNGVAKIQTVQYRKINAPAPMRPRPTTDIYLLLFFLTIYVLLEVCA